MSENPLAVQEVPTLPENHPAQKWEGWYPGKMNVAFPERGHATGCAFKLFTGYYDDTKNNVYVSPDELANAWFMQNPGLLVVDVKFETGCILIAYTKVLSKDEIDEFQEVQHEARLLIDERKAKRAEMMEEGKKNAEAAAKAAAEQAKADEKELKRLAELGKRHEKNCKKERA